MICTKNLGNYSRSLWTLVEAVSAGSRAAEHVVQVKGLGHLLLQRSLAQQRRRLEDPARLVLDLEVLQKVPCSYNLYIIVTVISVQSGASGCEKGYVKYI